LPVQIEPRYPSYSEAVATEWIHGGSWDRDLFADGSSRSPGRGPGPCSSASVPKSMELALSRLAMVTLATGAGFVVSDYYVYGG
jgi:hypothetical protein